MTALLLDLALARRIELAEAQAAVGCADTMERLRPGSGAAVLEVAGGFAVYCGADWPVTQAVGLGLDGSVSEDELSRLEEFYRSRKEPVRVETCPLAAPSLIQHFGKNGYSVTEFSNVMARALCRTNNGRESGDMAADVPAGITVERIVEGQIDLWTLTVAQGFSEKVAVTRELLETMRMFALGRNVECYLARVDGAVAGGGTLAIHERLAGLFGASTLPGFRNRGVQTALLRARLERASEAGCDLAACLAQPGSTSERNVVRNGFGVLYTRVKFERANNE
jgi:GNAT superfamily N-acetyltransferase